ncbi:unnamed protein product [Trichogramma brassicae]|uniref:Uncharacterized protein n=1 Tax=Trichogramma brassicae TaxID=86971 RepID=A0A6H5IMF7_9HYME|nr:unnamed protein product [Trichogramma brassicae]
MDRSRINEDFRANPRGLRTWTLYLIHVRSTWNQCPILEESLYDPRGISVDDPRGYPRNFFQLAGMYNDGIIYKDCQLNQNLVMTIVIPRHHTIKFARRRRERRGQTATGRRITRDDNDYDEDRPRPGGELRETTTTTKNMRKERSFEMRPYMQGGGIAVYIRNCIPHRIIHAPQIVTMNETECLCMEIGSGKQKLLFGAVYRRPDNYASTVIQRRAGCGTIDLAFELFAEDVGLASEDQLRSQNSTIYPHREQHLVAVLEKSGRAAEQGRGGARRQALLPDHMSGEEVPSARQQFEGGDRADAFQGARIPDGRARPARHVLQSESSLGLRKLSARAVRVLVAARGAAQPGARRHRHDLRESVGAVVIMVEQVEDQSGVHRPHDKIKR